MLEKAKKIHFVGISEYAEQDLAIALHKKGIKVSCSDEKNENISLALKGLGIAPAQAGWFPENISEDLDCVVVGNGIESDNAELLKAKAKGIRAFSIPEVIYELSKNKQRIVITGSYGKTTITSIVLHVLKFNNKDFDYYVGERIDGFETQVKLTDAPVIIIEGAETPANPLGRIPSFLQYHHHLALISGVAWNHFQMFPSYEDYVKQFEDLADATPKAGILFFMEEDDLAGVICRKERADVSVVEYGAHKHKIVNGKTFLLSEGNEIQFPLIGKHNMQNVSGAKAILKKIGISSEMFYKSLASYVAPRNRTELLAKNERAVVYKDLANAPSQLKAATKALKKQYPDRELVACFEFAPMNGQYKDYLKQYKDQFKSADTNEMNFFCEIRA